jgi:hypothetical protein
MVNRGGNQRAKQKDFQPSQASQTSPAVNTMPEWYSHFDVRRGQNTPVDSLFDTTSSGFDLWFDDVIFE